MCACFVDKYVSRVRVRSRQIPGDTKVGSIRRSVCTRPIYGRQLVDVLVTRVRERTRGDRRSLGGNATWQVVSLRVEQHEVSNERQTDTMDGGKTARSLHVPTVLIEYCYQEDHKRRAPAGHRAMDSPFKYAQDAAIRESSSLCWDRSRSRWSPQNPPPTTHFLQYAAPHFLPPP